MIALAMYSCLAGRAVTAQESGYSDAEVKAQFVEAGMFCHAEFIRRGCHRAFEMAGCDTNRYARILRELALPSHPPGALEIGGPTPTNRQRGRRRFPRNAGAS